MDLCYTPRLIVSKQQKFEIVPTKAEVVRQIFALYKDGWGYKKIASYRTEQDIPTPLMTEWEWKEAEGGEYRRTVKPVWSIVTVQGILDNDST